MSAQTLPPRKLSTAVEPGLPVPSIYGRYRLVERLGRGGTAEIYRAFEVGGDGYSLVVKRLRPKYLKSASARRLFVEEARLAAEIDHPNIVRVFGLEELPNQDLFMVMELVDGSDLRWLLNMARRRGRRLPVWLSLHIVGEVLAGLEHLATLTGPNAAHRNVVHCDVTPENIFLSSRGRIKLGDFGIAVEDTRPEDFHLGRLRGKLPYCSPEQALGERLDARSDVYAAAAVLWECLTGRPLVSTSDMKKAREAVLHGKRPRPSTLNVEVSSTLDDLVLAALVPERARRTPSPAVLRNRITRLLAGNKGTIQREDVVRAMGGVLSPAVSKDRHKASSSREQSAPQSARGSGEFARPGAETIPFRTMLHRRDHEPRGPMSLHDAIGKLADRAHVDVEEWGLSVEGGNVVSVQNFIRLLGIDLGHAALRKEPGFEVALTTEPLPNLFGQMSNTRSSGVLVVEREDMHGQESRHLRIAHGSLVDIWGVVSTLRLWAALTRPQHEDGEAFSSAIHRALAQECSITAVLEEKKQMELQEARRFEVHQQLEELFCWEDAVARFYPADLDEVPGAPCLSSLIPELVLQTFDETRLMRCLSPFLSKRVIPAREITSELEGLGLLDAECDALREILLADSLDAGLSGMPEQARTIGGATIYSLHAVGLLRFV